jgi:GNAT superfamily N-acetyltransferase
VWIRQRSDDDLPRCVGLLKAVHGSDGYPAWWPSDPTAWLTPPGYAGGWVAEATEDDRAIVGHVCVVRGVDDPFVTSLTGVSAENLASVSRLFVDATARGRHLGASLLAELSSWTSARGLRLMLDVVEDGAPAIALYERLGWQLVDRRPDAFLTPTGDRLPLRIYLAPASAPD